MIQLKGLQLIFPYTIDAAALMCSSNVSDLYNKSANGSFDRNWWTRLLLKISGFTVLLRAKLISCVYLFCHRHAHFYSLLNPQNYLPAALRSFIIKEKEVSSERVSGLVISIQLSNIDLKTHTHTHTYTQPSTKYRRTPALMKSHSKHWIFS